MPGFIKLDRDETLNLPFWKNSDYVKIWLYLNLRANYKDSQVVIDNQIISVKSGSFICSRMSLANDLQLDDSKINRALKLFEKLGKIEQQMNSRFRIITICYDESSEEIEQQMNSRRTADEQQMNTDKNIKNIRRKESKNKEGDTDLIADAISEEILSADARLAQKHNLIEKKNFGEFGNVSLSKAQFDMLKDSYDDEYILQMITEVDCWLENNPKEKKKSNRNDYARLKTFINNDRKWKEQRNAAR